MFFLVCLSAILAHLHSSTFQASLPYWCRWSMQIWTVVNWSHAESHVAVSSLDRCDLRRDRNMSLFWHRLLKTYGWSKYPYLFRSQPRSMQKISPPLVCVMIPTWNNGCFHRYIKQGEMIHNTLLCCYLHCGDFPEDSPPLPPIRSIFNDRA